jgi:hypothetical protein
MQKTKQQKETPLTTPFRFIYQKKKNKENIHIFLTFTEEFKLNGNSLMAYSHEMDKIFVGTVNSLITTKKIQSMANT